MFSRIRNNLFSLLAFTLIILVYLFIYFADADSEKYAGNFIVVFCIYLTGIGFSLKTLRSFYSDLTVAIVIIALAFGTNLFFITTLDYQLQPVLLFSLIAMIVYFTSRWHENQRLTTAILLFIIMGLVILFQRIGFCSLLIPIFWGIDGREGFNSKIKIIGKAYFQIILSAVCLLIIVLGSILIWNISPGEISLLSFFHPGVFHPVSTFLWNDLFSFDHGLFIYTPVIIFAFIGFYSFSEKNRPVFYSVFLFCIIEIFLESSWSKLGTTPVFGQIAFIPTYALLIIPMASFVELIQTGKSILRIILSLIIVIFILLNVFQAWQFHQGIILKSGMTPDNYLRVFGQTSLSDFDKQILAGIKPDSSLLLKNEKMYKKINLTTFNFEDTHVYYNFKLENKIVKSGKLAFTMDSATRFSPSLNVTYKDFTKQNRVGLRITVSVFVTNPLQFKEVNLVVSSIHSGNNYFYKRLNLGDLKLKPAVWNTIFLDYFIPQDPPPDDNLVSYVWFTGNGVIYIDDLSYDAFEPKK